MSYNLLQPFKIVTAGNMSGSITSAIAEVKLQDNVGFQLKWSGAPVGSFAFQVSMDHLQDSKGNVTVPGNWVSLPVSPAITAAGTPDDAYVDLNQVSATYVRVVYTRVSGTGVLDIFVDGKGV